LLLDPENPRLPPEVRGSDQRALALYIASNYDPLRVARSIAAHGYFSSEPLILIAAENGHDYIVVEGNRRLVALRGLSDEALRAEFEESGEWSELAAATHLPDLYPVVVAPSRRAVAPIIGYRHISGIEPWDPLAKARFVASLIDAADEPIGFAEVASIVGETVGDVRALYRNARIIEQARSDFGIDTTNAENEFGVFTRAMNSPALRAFIGAPAPSEVEIGGWPLPEPKAAATAELITWVFGDSNASGKVISESRDITTLGRVLASSDGIDVLRDTGNLEVADEAAGGPLARLLARLTQARNALRAAATDIDRFREETTVRNLLDECAEAVAALRTPT